MSLVIARLPIEALLLTLTLTLLLVAGLLRGVGCAAVEAVLRRLGEPANTVRERSEGGAMGGHVLTVRLKSGGCKQSMGAGVWRLQRKGVGGGKGRKR